MNILIKAIPYLTTLEDRYFHSLIESKELTGTILIDIFKNLKNLQCFQERTNSRLFLSYFTARQRSCGKVMFSLVSVCLFTRWRVSPCDHYPWFIGSLCTATPPPIPCYNPPRHETWDSLALLTASDTWWPSLETCSNLFTWGPSPPPPRILVTMRCTSYWNAFLFKSLSHMCLWVPF